MFRQQNDALIPLQAVFEYCWSHQLLNTNAPIRRVHITCCPTCAGATASHLVHCLDELVTAIQSVDLINY